MVSNSYLQLPVTYMNISLPLSSEPFLYTRMKIYDAPAWKAGLEEGSDTCEPY